MSTADRPDGVHEYRNRYCSDVRDGIDRLTDHSEGDNERERERSDELGGIRTDVHVELGEDRYNRTASNDE
jgi:hypothetical protein